LKFFKKSLQKITFLQALSFKLKQLNVLIDAHLKDSYSPQNNYFKNYCADIFFVISVFIA